MRQYFTYDVVERTLKQCEHTGINTVQSRGDYIMFPKYTNEIQLNIDSVRRILKNLKQ